MTAFSTIAGMILITLGFGDGAESRAPMGACVVGGMLTSTLLTLIVIPVVYSLIDDMQGQLARVFGWFRRSRRLTRRRPERLPLEMPVTGTSNMESEEMSISPIALEAYAGAEVTNTA